MTATAQGAALGCDYASCTRPGTVEIDAWAYCSEHAGRQHLDADPADAALAFTGKDGWHLQPSPAVVAVVEDAQDRRRAAEGTDSGKARTPARSPLGELLEQASGHSISKVRRLAGRIEAQLDDLRALIAQHAADEQRRQDEAAAKEKAKADIARLEQQLAAAKAKLRGPSKPKVAAPAVRVVDGIATGPNLCTGCAGPVTRPAGTRGQWPTRCTTCKTGTA